MKHFKLTMMALFAIAILSFAGCGPQQPYQGAQVVVNSATPTVSTGDNFNLQAVGELVKRCANSQALEDSINKPNGINNLVMPGDTSISYVHVKDFVDDNGSKGFKLFVIMQDNSTQDIATINIQAPAGTNSAATMNIYGNPNIYTTGNANYSANYSLSELLFWNYMLSPGYGRWCSPYMTYGYYPTYYHHYRYRPYSSYSGYTRNYTKTSRITTTTTTTTRKSPSFSNSNTYTKQRDIANRTQSARDFKVRDNSKPISTGGFSSKSSSNNSPKSSNSSSGGSSKSSSRNFGSSKSSFGSSSHSSGRRH